MRIRPSTRLNTIWLPKTGLSRFSSVAATSGMNLYMKMKKPTEKMMLRAATQPLISSFFFALLFGLKLVQRDVGGETQGAEAQGHAWPRVITPRTTGHPIHLCFSERRSSGSEWVDNLARWACGTAIAPSVRRAHHHAFQHGLAADQSLLSAFQRRQQLERDKETPHGSQKSHDC